MVERIIDKQRSIPQSFAKARAKSGMLFKESSTSSIKPSRTSETQLNVMNVSPAPRKSRARKLEINEVKTIANKGIFLDPQ